MSNSFLIKLTKTAGIALLIIFSINIAAMVFEYLRILNADQTINHFEYSNFKFYFNGRQTYNQFDSKNIVANLLIVVAVGVLAFRKNSSRRSLT